MNSFPATKEQKKKTMEHQGSLVCG